MNAFVFHCRGEDNPRGEDNLGEWGAGMGVSEHPTEAVDSSSQDFDWTAAQDSWGSGWSSAENDNEYNDESDNGGFFGPGSFKHRLKASTLFLPFILPFSLLQPLGETVGAKILLSAFAELLPNMNAHAADPGMHSRRPG